MVFQRKIQILLCPLFLLGISSSIKVNSGWGPNRAWNSLLIFPGTLWCGRGNITKNPEELGYYKETDACCRQHDKCKDYIDPKETKHGLTNKGSHDRLHCSCENDFLACLRNSTDIAGRKFGILYFDILKKKCYREDYPIKRCKRRTWWGNRCLKYELDETKPKKWQWFDVPGYWLS